MGFIVTPSKWEIQHARPIFAAQQYQAANNNQLPATRAWKMLEFRYTLNAGRFAFYHPNVARMFQLRDSTPPPGPSVPNPGVFPPPGGSPPIDVPPPIVVPPPIDGGGPPPLNPPAGQVINPPGGEPTAPQAVPEPASFILLAIAILGAGVFFHRGRRHP